MEAAVYAFVDLRVIQVFLMLGSGLYPAVRNDLCFVFGILDLYTVGFGDMVQNLRCDNYAV